MKKHFLTFLIFCPSFLMAESAPFKEELQSDRPDFTEGAYVVESSRFQLESGYTYSKSDGIDSQVAPEMLLRFGVLDSTELRLFWEGYEMSPKGDGATGFSIGFKQKLTDEDKLVPRMSLISEVGPVNPDEDYSQFEGGAKLLWEKNILGQDFAGNLNLFRRDDGSEVYVEGAGSVALGFDFTDTLGAYIEYYLILPFESGNHREYYINGGPTYLVNNNLQLDFRVGLGLDNDSDDIFIGSGLVYRR
jgi:hypothetical protein